MADKFYEKFHKKSKVAKAINDRKEFNKERDKFFEEKRQKSSSEYKKSSFNKNNFYSNNENSSASQILSVEKMFSNKLDKESLDVLENFDSIVQGIRPLNSKQFVQLPKDIRSLSHQLTDERESRRMGYMNANEELSAYVRYFTWWNLVRLTRVFSSLPSDAFNLSDGDFCLDLGSGPLTAVIALWLSRPELRKKNLTWYCVDISASTMALGEDLYLSIAAKTAPNNQNTKDEANSSTHWNIVRVKGGSGTVLKNKVSLITSANMFNEISQNQNAGIAPENIADTHIKELLSYSVDEKEDRRIFIAEPGMPQSAHFISLLRDRLISKNFSVESPCPHEVECPMSGYHARYGGKTKWCNFDFSTEDAPKKLLKLSKDSGIPKDRAVISFVFAKSKKASEKAENSLTLRIASDPIHLPNRGTGFYACSKIGLCLVINQSSRKLESGDKITIALDESSAKKLPRDKKSGALEILVK